MNQLGITRCGKMEFRWGERTYIMGIINLSPDSFSGDGLTAPESAVAQAEQMISEGADMLDIGGESTRPGCAPVSVGEEIKRVIPAIEQISRRVTVPISIDSYKYEVVRQALDAGAAIINDQWGLKREPRLAELAARRGAPLILMFNQRDKDAPGPDIRQDASFYNGVISNLISSLRHSMATALQAGVPQENIIIDPGLGFSHTWKYNLWIIRRMEELKVLKRPILLGPSRKSFIKMILNVSTDERIEGTAAAVAIGIANGADIVRVHDVKQMSRVCKVSDAIVRGN